MRDFDLIIFDWDGTLFDSIDQISRSLVFAAEEAGQSLRLDQAKDVIGLGLPEVMQKLFPQAAEKHQQILTTYAQHYVTNSVNDHFYMGINTLLSELKQKNHLIAVATGKNRAGLDRVLAKTNSQDFFVTTRSADETRSKPDPLMLTEILEQTGIDVERALMVGDSLYDMEMAQNIGMPRVAVSYGVHQTEQLAKCDPLFIAHNVAQLSDFLLKQHEQAIAT